jgi:hypothetical protein
MSTEMTVIVVTERKPTRKDLREARRDFPGVDFDGPEATSAAKLRRSDEAPLAEYVPKPNYRFEITIPKPSLIEKSLMLAIGLARAFSGAAYWIDEDEMVYPRPVRQSNPAPRISSRKTRVQASRILPKRRPGSRAKQGH